MSKEAWTIPECLQRLGEVAVTTGELYPQEAACIAEAVGALVERLKGFKATWQAEFIDTELAYYAATEGSNEHLTAGQKLCDMTAFITDIDALLED